MDQLYVVLDGQISERHRVLLLSRLQFLPAPDWRVSL